MAIIFGYFLNFLIYLLEKFHKNLEISNPNIWCLKTNENHYQVPTILYYFKVSFILQKILIWLQEKFWKKKPNFVNIYTTNTFIARRK